MRPTDLMNLIESRFAAGILRPVHIEGSPGLGKTEIVGQIAARMGVDYKVIHAPLLQPEDYAMPVISADKTDVSFISSKTKFPLERSDCGERGILLIDEIAQADASAQKILRNVILAREIHGQKLRPGWLIVTTGNRVTDSAGANKLLGHLSNVLTRITLEVSIDDWTQWAFANGVKPEVISFARFRPNLLNDYEPKREVNATPRSWTQGVSAQIGVIDPSLEFEAFKGDVGEGPAAEFIAYLKICRKLPSPDAIMIDPDSVDVPDDPATQYAICGALAARVSADNFGRLMKFVGKLPPEFSVLFVRDATAKDKNLAAHPDFIRWMSGPGKKLLA